MRPKPRTFLLGATLLGTLVLVWLAPHSAPSPEVSAPVVRSHEPHNTEAMGEDSSLTNSLPHLRNRASFIGGSNAGVRHELFGVAAAAPRPAPAPEVVLRPAAPTLPFIYLGKELRDGRWTVFLAENESTWILHEGDVVDSVYRVERIDPPNMTLIYLPLHENQSLVIQ